MIVTYSGGFFTCPSKKGPPTDQKSACDAIAWLVWGTTTQCLRLSLWGRFWVQTSRYCAVLCPWLEEMGRKESRGITTSSVAAGYYSTQKQGLPGTGKEGTAKSRKGHSYGLIRTCNLIDSILLSMVYARFCLWLRVLRR